MNLSGMKGKSGLACMLTGATAMLSLLLPCAAWAQTYPAKVVTLVLPFAPGGSSDVIARVISQQLTKTWGQSMVLDFRSGGNTIIGTESVVKAAPDGYTLLFAPGNLSTNVGLYAGKLPYDVLRDLAPVMLINTSPQVLVVPAGSQPKSIKELIAQAKADPGKMNFGSSSVGGINHLAAELFNILAGTSAVHVPYKGGAPAMTDLMSGRLDFMFSGTTGVLPNVQSGKLRALAVTSAQRVASLPDVPTLEESGFAGFQSSTWNGLMAPAKVSQPVINRINADANKALASPELQQRLQNDGSISAGGGPEVLAAFLKEDTARWVRVVKDANIKPE